MLKREMEFGRYNTFRVSGSGAEDHRRAREKELLQKTTWPIASWSPRETRLPGAAQSQSRALRMNCQRHEPIRSFWSLGWNGSRDAFQPRPLRGVRCGIAGFPGCGQKRRANCGRADSRGGRFPWHNRPAWVVEFGEQVVGTLSGVLTWTVPRKAHGDGKRT